MMQIPWVKPIIGREEWEAARECFETGWFSMGKRVKELEQLMAMIVGSPYAIAVNSGTAALDVALKLIGVKTGDEVIIPALSYIATGNAVLYQHAVPVFADIDRETYTISPESVKQKITDRTKAVIAIDYAGQAADYESLKRLLKQRGIFLIEDAAPGLGGEYKGKPLCSIGDISITSFHMAKLITSIEGGMVFVERKEWDEMARMIRSQGEDGRVKYRHAVLGHNYRMTDLHAAIGLEQAKRFRVILERKQRLADCYSQALAGVKDIVIPSVALSNKHAWFLYPILIPSRDKVAMRLRESGIETNISWPLPIYRQKIYQNYYRTQCPVAEWVAAGVLSLPIYPEMTQGEQDYVIDTLCAILKEI